ncbi:alpha/beta hydrolase fold domain-containing protein [Noviherbaspirillum sp. UKPF54]|uniref:alpha/beta hydrolase fold domain-containing protein n=1 Tax=Noviherbaspirillum sp. UKPF54 TaxID=2601898 RepID=UPI0011B18FDF|nr:alpha/beta hydrolase fold domain-containing protein [Noviherbaspirillum sp. UKPF54]QDZ29605.1 steryl acetyl hydrolase [Noviherbaspirillum sp. UKPF54]
MSSWQARFFSALLRRTFKRRLAAAADAAGARRVLGGVAYRAPKDVTITPHTLGGVPGEWVESRAGGGSVTLLYLHGGGYFACSPRTHRAVTTYFARQGFRVFVPDYRLAPEFPFPAAIEDAESVYTALLNSGCDPARLVVAGDSAGGGLALALMLRLRDDRMPMPAAAALFSPLTDMENTLPSRMGNSSRCAMFVGERMPLAAEAYLAGADPCSPLASPVRADLRGLPPLLIHVGTDEVLLDDSTELARRAQAAGVAVDLRVWPAVPHVWQLFHWFIPEGRESLAAATAFLKKTAAFGAADGRATTAPARPDLEAVIIGTGFSGLGMAIRLKQAGIASFLLLEKSREIGGTWRENTYPGCACDVPSHMYSFSFERKADWSRMYSGQAEILAYLRHCVDKYRLAPHICFGAEMRDAVFDEANDLWRVRTADGRSLTARIVVSAMGALHRPAYPALPGIERFRGVAFHSAEWNHGYDLSGKRIAVIGTGASAIQFVPQIAPRTAQLTLFQRTPAWVLPKMDHPISRRAQAILRRVPGAMRLLRCFVYWRQELGGLAFLHPKLMTLAEKMGRRHIARHIADPALRAKLTPGYTIGCKRILLSNDYYPALARPNVAVVTDTIAEVTEDGIVDSRGVKHAADAIVYGTGFRVTDLLSPVRFVGRGGIDLNDAWRDGAQAYCGLMAAGYPNLFMLLGPNTGLGHNSVVFMAEQQIDHAMKCLKLMRKNGMTSIEVNPQAQAQFNARLQQRMHKTVWASGCKSWYLDAHGRNVTLWPGFTFSYWARMKRVRLPDYRFGRAGDVSHAGATGQAALHGN